MKKARTKRMETGIIIFLSAALVIIAAATVVFACRCRTLHENRDELYGQVEKLNDKINVLQTLNRDLKREKAVLFVENKHLHEQAQELIELNKVLSAPAKPAAVSAVHPKERLPEGVATNRYDCEGYNFPAGTEQAKLQERCYTSQTGMRIFNGDDLYFCAALGNAYGTDIGDAWRVTLRNGFVFKVIRADYQHDISDPDPEDFGERYEYDSAGNVVGLLRNYDGEICVHVLEFIADLQELLPEVKAAGGFHGDELFGGIHGDGGNIVKIEYLGRKWEP